MDLGYGSYSGMGMIGETGRFEKLDGEKKKPYYDVYLPYGPSPQWPSRCSLCCKPSIAGNKEIKSTFKSGEYGVARKNTTITVPGLPYCEDCLKRISHTKVEAFIALIGVGIGFAIFLFLALIAPWGWCMGLIMGVIFAGAFFPIARLFTKNRAEEPSVKLVMGTEQKMVGNNRATHFKFKFRNRRYAYEFASCNNALTDSMCEKCDVELSKGKAGKLHCITCFKKV